MLAKRWSIRLVVSLLAFYLLVQEHSIGFYPRNRNCDCTHLFSRYIFWTFQCLIIYIYILAEVGPALPGLFKVIAIFTCFTWLNQIQSPFNFTSLFLLSSLLYFHSVLLFPAKMFLIRKIISFVLTSKEFHNNNFFGHIYAIKLIN